MSLNAYRACRQIVLNDLIISLHSLVVNFYRGAVDSLISQSFIKAHVFALYYVTMVDDCRINRPFFLFRARSNTLSNGKGGAKSEYEIGDLSDEMTLVIGMCNFSCISDITHGSRKKIFWMSD